MTLPLHGRTIALAEGRQLEDLAQMLEAEGATVVRCPLVSILDAPDPAPVIAWLRELVSGRFAYVILMTGEGVRRLLGFAERVGLRAAVIAALGRSRTVTRGPKPARALKEIGLAPREAARTPTTEGIIETLRHHDLSGLAIGVQMYSAENPALLEFLRAAGGNAWPVLPYVYAPAPTPSALPTWSPAWPAVKSTCWRSPVRRRWIACTRWLKNEALRPTCGKAWKRPG